MAPGSVRVKSLVDSLPMRDKDRVPLLVVVEVVPDVVVVPVVVDAVVELALPGVTDRILVPCKAAPRLVMVDFDTSKTMTSIKTSAFGRSRS